MNTWPDKACPTAANSLARRTVAEGLATALLLAAVVGSGIMGERLAADNTAIALLANAAATGAALVTLILSFAPISGAHMNPSVTLLAALRGELRWGDARFYWSAQIAGAFLGVGIANLMFDEPMFFASHHVRQGASQMLSEIVATFGLLNVVLACGAQRPPIAALAVGGYITSAYWFTASTSFANPAATLARAATDTFAGIGPGDVPGFLVAQLAGTLAAISLGRWLMPVANAAAPVSALAGEERPR